MAAYLLAPADGSYELEKLGLTYYNHEFPKARDTYLADGAFGPLADQGAAAGALMSHTALIGALRDTLTQRLKELGMWELYERVELPLCPVLAEMEQAGFRIDRRALARLRRDAVRPHRPLPGVHLSAGRGGVQHQLHPEHAI